MNENGVQAHYQIVDCVKYWTTQQNTSTSYQSYDDASPPTKIFSVVLKEDWEQVVRIILAQ